MCRGLCIVAETDRASGGWVGRDLRGPSWGLRRKRRSSTSGYSPLHPLGQGGADVRGITYAAGSSVEALEAGGEFLLPPLLLEDVPHRGSPGSTPLAAPFPFFFLIVALVVPLLRSSSASLVGRLRVLGFRQSTCRWGRGDEDDLGPGRTNAACSSIVFDPFDEPPKMASKPSTRSRFMIWMKCSMDSFSASSGRRAERPSQKAVPIVAIRICALRWRERKRSKMVPNLPQIAGCAWEGSSLRTDGVSNARRLGGGRRVGE